MAYHSYKRSLDRNHTEIVKALRSIGCSVTELDKLGNSVPDLLVSMSPDKTLLLEVKVPTGKFYVAQLRYLATFKGFCAFAETIEEAIKVCRNPAKFALSEKDKLKVLKIVMAYESKSVSKQPQITVAKFDKEFAELNKEKRCITPNI